MGRKSGSAPFTPRVTGHDAAVWHALDVERLLNADALDRRPEILTPFPPAHGREERVLASGPMNLLDHRAPGDGTYVRNNSMFMATGRGGLALTGAFAVGRIIGNSSRKAAAQAAAVPRWMSIESGGVHVSTHAFYLDVGRILRWDYTAITSGQLVAPAHFQFGGLSDAGKTISWILASDWAELAFFLWARRMHPRHPQYQGHAWVPPGWKQRMEAAGYQVPGASPPSSTTSGVGPARITDGTKGPTTGG